MVFSVFARSKIYTDDKNYIEIKLSDTLIEGLKQKKHFTTIDLATSNKFKTKYGIVIYEIYLRYKNAKRDEIPLELTYQDFSLDELNKNLELHTNLFLKCWRE